MDKNNEQYKRLCRYTVSLIILCMEFMVFAYMWYHYFNLHRQIPFENKGNMLVLGIYGIVLAVLFWFFGGTKIGYLKKGNLILSQVLAIICTNLVMMVELVLLGSVLHLVRQILVEVAIMTVADIVILLLVNQPIHALYRRLFPEKRILVIYGERTVQPLLDKIKDRSDKYIVGACYQITGQIEDAYPYIDQYEAVMISDVQTEVRNKLIKYCYHQSKQVYVVPKLSDIILKGSETIHLFDTPLYLCRNYGFTPEQRFVKRIEDIVCASIILLITSPILILTALAIKLYDKGPVFFCQERCTVNGRIFSIYKFRSMICDAEKEGQVIPATDRDPRITPVGRWIRRSRIDELPQMFNILKGDMSLIGPRPERIEHVRKYTSEIPEFSYRMKVKGGLTGYAQIYGKYNTTAYDKLKLDLMYIQNYSILLDLEILLKTIKIVFIPESTEGFTDEASREISMTTEDHDRYEG